GLLANLVPFTLVNGGEKGTLRCHVARANDQVEALKAGAETLIVFQGPEAYIAPPHGRPRVDKRADQPPHLDPRRQAYETVERNRRARTIHRGPDKSDCRRR